MEFAEKQKVVYPNHGVGVIEKIEQGMIDDVEQVYYHLRLLSNNSKVMIPEGNLDLVGLRPLVSDEEIDKLLDILADGNIDTYKDWKGRYKQNLDKMKTGGLREVAEVLKNLRLVSQRKSLSFREKKMYERAKYFIVSEVAQVKDISERGGMGFYVFESVSRNQDGREVVRGTWRNVVRGGGAWKWTSRCSRTASCATAPRARRGRSRIFRLPIGRCPRR